MHRLLLRLYPASFRNEYGEELRRVFAQRRRQAGGPVGIAALWLGEIADTVMAASQVHIDILRQDLRHTRRSLWRSRGFALTAIVVTALGVGATTAVVSVADHVFVRPLPFAVPDRVVKIWQSQPEYSRIDVSPANYRDWQAMSSSFSGMGAYAEVSSNLIGGSEPTRLSGADVTSGLLTLLGVSPSIGHLFSNDDNRPGAPGTVLLSDGVWRGRFGADRSIVGRTVVLDNETCTVIGVMPASFQFPTRTVDFWRPIRFNADSFENRGNLYLRVMARLKTGTSREQARADLTAVAARLERAYPKENAKIGATLIDLRDEVGQLSRVALYTLLGAGACVLLIACTNLASLLIARASARERELTLRAALGAGRERLVRQLLTESLVIALVGGALGLLLAIAIVPLIVTLVPSGLPIAEQPHVDARMLLLALSTTIATGLGFGVAPALRAARSSSTLRDGARAGVSRRTEHIRGGLVILQVTMSVVLLAGSGLLIRALWRVSNVDPGFRTSNVLTMRTTLPMPKYGPQASRIAFYRRVLDDVRAVPGVTSVAYTTGLPMTMRGGIWPAFLPGKPRDAAQAPTASVRYVTPDYFAVMGVPVRLGRPFAESDTMTSEKTVIVSESFVNAHWPGQDPRGKQFFIALFDRTVVGVVGDVRVRGLERESEPQVYLPYQQQLDNMMVFYTPKDLVMRIGDESQSGSLAASVRAIIRNADPELPIADVKLMSAVVDGDLRARSAQVSVLGAFAAVACLLAAVGLHGLLAFIVSQRTREIGVRLALGAAPRQVLLLVTRRGLALAIVGAVAGVGLAFVAGRSMQAMLAGVDPRDPVTLLFAVAVSLASALVGTLLPARRASRVSPTEALRAD